MRPEGFEPPTNGFGSHYSIRLSYERLAAHYARTGAMRVIARPRPASQRASLRAYRPKALLIYPCGRTDGANPSSTAAPRTENFTSKARPTAANSDVHTVKRMTAAERRCYPLQHEQARFRERAHGPCADVARAPGTVLEVGPW